MILDAEKLNSRLNSPENLANRFVKKEAERSEATIHEVILHRTANKGENKLPESIREEIAVRAKLGENFEQLGREFGITKQAVDCVNQNKRGTLDEARITERVNEVRDLAMEKLLNALGLIGDDKLAKCDAKDLSSISANLSRVVEKTMARESNESPINFNIFVPEIKPEKSFKVIEVG